MHLIVLFFLLTIIPAGPPLRPAAGRVEDFNPYPGLGSPLRADTTTACIVSTRFFITKYECVYLKCIFRMNYFSTPNINK